MLLKLALDEMLLAKDYTDRSRKERRTTLSDFIRWASEQGVDDLSQLTRLMVREYVAHLRVRPNKRTGGKWSSETQHGYASQLRAFLRWCVEENWLNSEVVARFEMPKLEKKVVYVLSYDHYALLHRATDNEFIPALRYRDKALLAMMIDTGVRAMEACTLRLEDVFVGAEAYIHVRGKGRKNREIGVGKTARQMMSRYLHNARPASDSDLFFLDRAGRPLTPNAIDRTLYRLRNEAGRENFNGLRVSAHTLRHSFAVHYMESGAGDIYKLSRLLGHESVSTTERYLRAFQARDARRTSKSVLDNMA